MLEPDIVDEIELWCLGEGPGDAARSGKDIVFGDGTGIRDMQFGSVEFGAKHLLNLRVTLLG